MQIIWFQRFLRTEGILSKVWCHKKKRCERVGIEKLSGVVDIIETECYYHIFWATEYWTLGLFPPKEGGLWYDLYKKKEGGGGSSPLFGVNRRAVSRLSWPLFCSGIKIPLSWGISMKQKQRDRFVKILVFCQHISSWSRDFEKGVWLVVCKEKIEFYCGIGLNKTRRSGLESGLDVAFWGGTQ